MTKEKKTIIAIIMTIILSFSMMILAACTPIDSDDDGFTDDFENEHSDVLDADEPNWNVDSSDLMD